MNINFKGETFDLACHHVEIEEYDEVIILWINKYPHIHNDALQFKYQI